MKKLLLMILAVMVMLPCAAQRSGLVKDEDGYTNIRKGPGTNYEIVDQVPDGMFINYGPGTGKWYKVSAKVQVHVTPLWAKCVMVAIFFAVATTVTVGLKFIPRREPSVAI